MIGGEWSLPLATETIPTKRIQRVGPVERAFAPYPAFTEPNLNQK
jgi:hypothetical protein